MQSVQTCHSEQCRLAALSAHSRRLRSLPAVQHARHRGTPPRAPTVQRKRKATIVRAEDLSADKLELGLVRLVKVLTCVCLGFDCFCAC